MIYVGKKVPKGFKEVAGSIHLGKGIWMFKVVSDEDENRD